MHKCFCIKLMKRWAVAGRFARPVRFTVEGRVWKCLNVRRFVAAPAGKHQHLFGGGAETGPAHHRHQDEVLALQRARADRLHACGDLGMSLSRYVTTVVFRPC